jgi:hypothetical protein
LLAGALALLSSAAMPVRQDVADVARSSEKLEEARLTMGKWIETQQILSKERKEWQQGKEILQARLELGKQEVGVIEEKLAQARSDAEQAEAKRKALIAETEALKEITATLAVSITGMEDKVRKLYAIAPEPVRQRLGPLYQRIPEDPAKTRASVAERLQNVLGILNELNKANGEITVHYEVRELADGKPAEVRAMYVGLAQAYYVSAGGEAGIGRPAENGWKWDASKNVAADVLVALEIQQGKHTPAFVPLPAKVQ